MNPERVSWLIGRRFADLRPAAGSAARLGGLPMETHHAASKGALDSLTVGLAREVGNERVRVVGIRPGLIETAIHEAHRGQATLEAMAPGAGHGHIVTYMLP